MVATGGTAAIPNIPGLKEAPYLTNATVFNLTELPQRMAVIGAGPIGIELAQAFQRFGSQVTVFSRSDKILPKEDPDAAKIIETSLRRDGVTFAYHANYRRVESQNGKPPVTIILEQGNEERKLEFDALLVATGRKPTVKGLGLEHAGVEYDERMGVAVNDRLQTTNPNIYAVGDVASKYQFTHMADFGARLVIRNALFFGRDNFSNLLIPWATYTDPEVAHVGLYEKDLQERNIAFATFTREFAEVDRGIVDGETEGFVKIQEGHRPNPGCDDCQQPCRRYDQRGHSGDAERDGAWQTGQCDSPLPDFSRGDSPMRRRLQPGASHADRQRHFQPPHGV